MDDDALVRRVAGMLSHILPEWEPGEVGSLAGRMVDALFPDGMVLTEQCAIRWPVADGPPEITRVARCDVADEIARMGRGAHVHRMVLKSPWSPAKWPGVPIPAPRPDSEPGGPTAGAQAI